MAQTKIKLIADGVIDENHLKVGHTITTDNIGEGTNLYYTDTRVGSYLSTNSYATEGYVTTAVANLVDAAPSTLDTLNELAAALGDDPNFATTVTNSIATKLPLAGGTLTGDLIVNTNVGIGVAPQTSTWPSLQFVNGNGITAFPTANIPASYYTSNAIYDGSFKYSTSNPAWIMELDAYNDNFAIKSAISGTAGNAISWLERIRITSTGNVGIGTSSPSQKFQVYNSSNGTSAAFGGTTYGIRIDNGGTYSAGESTIFGVDDTFYGTYQPLALSASQLSFKISNNERMRINSSGDIGIGTDTPIQNWTGGAKKILHLKAGSGASAIVTIGDNDGTNGNLQLVGASNGDAGVYNFANGNMRFGTDGAERMRIDSSGRITMPYQPGFKATSSSNVANQPSSGADANIGVRFNLTSGYGSFNNGNNYNTTTGVFTAPVSGKYFVFGHMRWETGDFTQSSYIRLYVSVNGGSYKSGIHQIAGNNEAWSNYMPMSVSGVVELSAGDTLALRGGMNGGVAVGYWSEGSFGAYLLG